MKKSTRRHDLRRIRTQHTYSVQETADLLKVTKGTVREWLKNGLPKLEGGRPILIHGAYLKDWLAERQASRKKPCLPNEMFCLKCRLPRKSKPASARAIPRNEKTFNVTALCCQCDARMNRIAAKSKLEQTCRSFDIQTIPQPRLTESDIPTVNRDLEKECTK